MAISYDIKTRIDNRALNLPPIRLTTRTDGMCKKVRVIGVESVMQQLMEHVAVGCMQELWTRKIAYHQYASIKGKGQLAGAKTIRKWAQRHAFRYFVKLDIRKCFPSIRHDVVMRFLEHDIGKNKTLLWFVSALLENHGDGLIIGSLLSQFLCNYLLSYGYRYTMALHKTRRGKRKKLVAHALFYMDDILLTGNDRRDLKMAVREVVRFFRLILGLEIKPNWHVKDFSKEPIDMMGFKVREGGKLKVRGRVFLRARRAFAGFDGSVKMARRLSSYYGFFKHCHILLLTIKRGTVCKIRNTMTAASAVISMHDRRTKTCLV